MKFFEELKSDKRNLETLKWWIIIGFFLAIFAYVAVAINILYFESDESGMFATHETCIAWDEACMESCQSSQNPRHPHSCESCCLVHDAIKEPIGERIKSEGFKWALFSFGASLVIAVMYTENKK